MLELGEAALKSAFIIIWQKIFKAVNEEKKNLSLKLEEDGGHKREQGAATLPKTQLHKGDF